MQAIKIIQTVKNGKASVDVPKEFGNEVEIIALPVNDKSHTTESTDKSVKKIGGMFKNQKIDYEKVNQDLKELSKKAEIHLLEKNSHE